MDSLLAPRAADAGRLDGGPGDAGPDGSEPGIENPGAGIRFSIGPIEFDKVRGMLAAKTSFSAGRELALALEPSADLEVVEWRQAATAEARRLPTLKPGLTLGGARDVRAIAQRASIGGLLQPVELLDVAATVRAARLWRATLTRLRDQLPNLAQVADRLDEHRPLLEEIAGAIEESGEVADDASPRLRQIRNELRTAQDRLLTRLREMLHSATIRPTLQDAVITQRNGRYVLPIRAEYRNRVKGIVHDQSASGATLFVEPLPIVEAGNRVRELEAQERHEVERILRALSNQVAVHRHDLDATVEALAELDLHQAKGRLADETDAVRPRLHALPRTGSRPIVRLIDARHPLLRGEVVPLSLELGGEFDVLVITGPNTGGKTVALKTVGLLALMAQAGLQVPAADGSELAVFHSIQADIGDEQSIEQSLSTFSSHVTHIVRMLRDVDACSLVLLDELGAGTDPQEGSALARAILTYLRDRGAFTIATTHYSELKAFAHQTPRVENASVEFDLRTLAPTYRLLVGVPGQSNALAIAARLGLPAEIVEQARALLDPQTVEAEALLGDIQRERAEVAAATSEARRRAEDAERLRRRTRDELRQTERARREVLRQARAESERLLADLRREADRRLAELRSVGAEPRRVRAAVESLEALRPLTAPEPGPEIEPEPVEDGPVEVRPGAEIVVPRLGVPARVLQVAPNGDAELDVRGMRVRVRAAELAEARPASRRDRAAVERETTGAEPPILTRATAAPAAPPIQLDLRGLRRDEAAEALDRYLNDAYLGGLRSVRIVHGKGTGAVRAAVREQLSRHPLVSRFAAADAREGGDGATEVTLAQ
jgi:DNA mismatch repair protein MutS2